MHLAEVFFVLGGCTGTKTNGITEIVDRISRHDSVEVNHANRFSGILVQHNIVHLGIVMRNTLGYQALRKAILKNIRKLSAFFGKLNLGFGIVGTSGSVALNSFNKIIISYRSVMKVRNSFKQLIGRKTAEPVLKISESHSRLVKIVVILRQIKRNRIGNEHKSTPETAVTVYVKALTVLGFYDVERLTLRISSGVDNLIAKKRGNVDNI